MAALFFIVANILASFYSEKFNYHENFRANFYSTCVTGFAQTQCAAYATGISPEMLQQINAAHPEPDASVVRRVIEGIIPDAASIAAQKTAAEAAAASAAATAAVGADSVTAITADTAAADTAAAAKEQGSGDASAAENAASVAAAAVADDDDDVDAAAAHEVPVAEQPQAIVNVAPANAPISLPLPALNAAPPDNNAENNTKNLNPNPAPAKQGIIVDQGQGASGELLLQ